MPSSDSNAVSYSSPNNEGQNGDQNGGRVPIDLARVRAELSSGRWVSASRVASGTEAKIKASNEEARATQSRLTGGYKAASELSEKIIEQSKEHANLQLFMAEIMGCTQELQAAAMGLSVASGVQFEGTVPGPATVARTKTLDVKNIPSCLRNATLLMECVADIIAEVAVQQSSARVSIAGMTRAVSTASVVSAEAYTLVTTSDVAGIKKRSAARERSIAAAEEKAAKAEAESEIRGLLFD